MPDLNGEVILITGGNRGQGKAIAEHLAALGARVVIGARQYESAKDVASSIGKSAYPVQLDVTKQADWEAVMDEIGEEFGRLDTLVNNAGILKRKPFTKLTIDDYQEMVNVNQFGVFLGMQSVVPFMEKQQKGSIVNNVSISAFAPIG